MRLASFSFLLSFVNTFIHNNLLAPNTTYSWYRRREKDLVQYFSMKETFVYCHDVAGLLQAMSCIYDSTEWGLFIDSSKPSLKCVLPHNGNRYASIPIGHSVYLLSHQCPFFNSPIIELQP